MFVNVSLIVRLRTQGFLFLNTGKGIKVETGSMDEGLLTTNSSAYFVQGTFECRRYLTRIGCQECKIQDRSEDKIYLPTNVELYKESFQ